jgi:hypothetical protein
MHGEYTPFVFSLSKEQHMDYFSSRAEVCPVKASVQTGHEANNTAGVDSQ